MKITETHTTALHDFEPAIEIMLRDVQSGLSQTRKTMPSKYFYDEAGSVLFDKICELPEYYPTRTEMQIMTDHIEDMTDVIGDRCQLIEYGSGSSLKTRILLDAAINLASYVPVDISRSHLLLAANRLREMYPYIEVLPVCADYTRPFVLPRSQQPSRHAVVYFPGSTIGNFTPEQALGFLASIADTCGKGGGLLIGVDVKKDKATLEAAYNDSAGVTADFNKNILVRMNRELGSNFIVDQWDHKAVYDDSHGRIEMHLTSQVNQKVCVDDMKIQFRSGETIMTEVSYKYALSEFEQLADRAGWQVQQVWTDHRALFSVQYLTVC